MKMKEYILKNNSKYRYSKFGRMEKGRGSRKWLKYALAFSFLGTSIFGVIAIWGMLAVMGQLARFASPEKLREMASRGGAAIEGIASQAITNQKCIETLASLMSPTKLLTVPIVQSFESAKSVCWAGANSTKI